MKRYGNLFEQISSFENLERASRKARLGKRFKSACAMFEHNREAELVALQEELQNHTYAPGEYHEFEVYDRKPRKISAAPYRDRVVHHAVCSVVEPIFERTFIHDSYACRVGKGTHAAVDRFTHFARRFDYVLKTDIKKYFPSIDHAILMQKIERKIKCRDTLNLIKLIIDGSNQQEQVIDYFEGDSIFTPFERRRGIPIGNLTSQFFANVYLDELDHFMKEQLHCQAYIRYVDDMTAFGDDKRKLWDIRDLMVEFLEKDRLRLHPKKTYMLPVSEGIDHLGYRIFPDHRRVRKDNSFRFARKLRQQYLDMKARKITFGDIDASVQSWIGHVKHADAFGLREKIFNYKEKICQA